MNFGKDEDKTQRARKMMPLFWNLFREMDSLFAYAKSAGGRGSFPVEYPDFKPGEVC